MALGSNSQALLGEAGRERTRSGGAGEAAGGKLTQHLCFGPSPPCLHILNINFMQIKRGKNKHFEKIRDENIHSVFFDKRDEPTLKKCKCSRNQETPGITHYETLHLSVLQQLTVNWEKN